MLLDPVVIRLPASLPTATLLLAVVFESAPLPTATFLWLSVIDVRALYPTATLSSPVVT